MISSSLQLCFILTSSLCLVVVYSFHHYKHQNHVFKSNIHFNSLISKTKLHSFYNIKNLVQYQKYAITTKSRLFSSFIDTQSTEITSKKLQKLFSCDKFKFTFLQYSNGKTPRSYLPGLILIESVEKDIVDFIDCDINQFYNTLEETLQWYLDSGGRVAKLEIACSSVLEKHLSSFGNALKHSHFLNIPNGYNVFSLDAQRMINHLKYRISNNMGKGYVINDILGRIFHDIGDPKTSIDYYTKALQEMSTYTAAFRNLGSAYQAIGNTQLAFASYQQAIQLDPNDALVYLKLAFFYEDFASKDWKEAAENAQSCYEYYLKSTDSEDVSILTRLGNLYVREHKSEEAISTYNKALSLEPKQVSVWFNKAHAEIKLGRYNDAAESLRQTLRLDPSISAARHMLKALVEEEAQMITKSDESYITDLYNSYARNYDQHNQKLLYSAPRVIRQEMAKIYRTRKDITGLDESEIEIIVAPSSSTKCESEKDQDTSKSTCPEDNHDHDNCTGQISFMDRKLDILDLGCGTGLAGAWLKDYAKSLVGVDVSSEMVEVAMKKMLYDSLYTNSITNFLQECKDTYDLIVAADVLSYIGDLHDILIKVSKVIRPGGYFVFTAETANQSQSFFTNKGFRLLKNGRFGYSRDYLNTFTNIMSDDNRTFEISL